MGSKLYGVTHNATTGQAVIRVPKVLKVSIGLLKGPDINVKIAPDGKWHVRLGDGKTKGTVSKFNTKEEAKTFYYASKANVPVRAYPAKLPYFSFSRSVGDDGLYEADFDAIEAHGPVPTSIPIFLVDNDPLDAGMAYWSASELRCKGDGRDAMRNVAFSAGNEEIAKTYADKGEKYFPIIGGCETFGCIFAQRDDKGRKGPCGPKGKLIFQLALQPMVGGTAFLDTTSRHSIGDLHSCLETIKLITGKGVPERGRIIGIPLLLVLKHMSSKTADGKKATYYTTHIEYRGPGAGAEIIHQLMESSAMFNSDFAALPSGPAVPDEIPVLDAEEIVDVRFGTETEQAEIHTAEFTDGEVEPDEEADESHELQDDEPAVVEVKAPPPVAQARAGISKSGQTTKKRSERILTLANTAGKVDSAKIIDLMEKISKVKIQGAKSLTPPEHKAVEGALADLEALSKEELMAALAAQ